MTEFMRRIDREQQLRRIARLLAVDESALSGLRDVPVGDLRTLHDQIAESLFASHADSFARVASVSKVIPGAVAGKLAERFLQPSLAARAAVMLEPTKARDLVNKVSVAYLADVALGLDPVRGTPVIRAIPPARVAEVARALFDRGELAAMAEFAGAVDKTALEAALEVASPSQLVMIAPLLAWNDNIAQVIDGLPDDRVDAILTAIADDALWPEASVLLRRLGAETLGRIVERLRALPDVAERIPTELVGELAVDLFETGELETMVLFLPVVPDAALARAMEVAGGANLLRIAPLLDWTERVHDILERLTDEQLDAVLRDMAAQHMWTEAAVLLREVRPAALARVAERLGVHRDLAERIPPQLIADLATDLFADGQLETMVLFVPVVSREGLHAAITVAGAVNLLRIAPMITWTEDVVAALEALPDSYLDALLTEVVDKDLFVEGEALVARLDGSLRARVVERMIAAPPQLLARIRDAVSEDAPTPTLRDMVAAVASAVESPEKQQ